MEQKLKHLEFIQATITRMAHNSFLIKAWSITLVSGTFVLLAKDLNLKYVFFAYVPTIFFWYLDAYYLWQERLYRAHYDSVRKNELHKIDFCMKPEINKESESFYRVFFSKTLVLYYIGILVTLLVILILS